MDKLIAIEKEEKYFFNNFEDLVKKFLCPKYYESSPSEQREKLERKTYMNALVKGCKIIDIRHSKESITNLLKENIFILYDDMTYILSLVKNNSITLLERIDTNIIPVNIDKSKIEENYLIINNFIDDIIKDYLLKKGYNE